MHTITEVAERKATQPGALDGYAAYCSCGDFVTSIFEEAARRLGTAHVEYMNRKEGQAVPCPSGCGRMVDNVYIDPTLSCP